MLFCDGAAERGRTDHLHVWSMPQNVHQNFLGIAVGDFQLQAAIGPRANALLRVPFLPGDPPRGNGIEQQHGGMLGGAGKYPIAVLAARSDLQDLTGVKISPSVWRGRFSQ